ncbi:glycosyltransferase family 2 protein [bacterium]|nr:glycosyltransferase family 2 protein [bacterium]
MISVLIVTYRSERYILPCLSSLPGTVDGGVEVCVVDNSLSDETRALIGTFMRGPEGRRIRVIPGREPRSYAAAVNLGLRACRGDWICLLGPDTRMGRGCLEYMIRYLRRHPEAGAAAPRLTDDAGRPLPSCRRFPGVRDALLEMSGLPRLWPSRFTPRWKMPDFRLDRIADVDQPEATCLLLRRRVVDAVGPMDERFPLFFNDVDWCRRIRTAGWRIVFLPEASVEHVRGASVNREPFIKIWRSHQGFYRYLSKHIGSGRRRPLLPVLGWLFIVTAVLRAGWTLMQLNPGKNE